MHCVKLLRQHLMARDFDHQVAAFQVHVAVLNGFTARFIDRVGKGIRGASRDALVADIAPPELRVAAFGLPQSLDTVGAFLGPLLAIGLMWLFADDFALVFWVAVIPAFAALALILFAVQ